MSLRLELVRHEVHGTATEGLVVDVDQDGDRVTWSVANTGDHPAAVDQIALVFTLPEVRFPLRLFRNGYQSWSVTDSAFTHLLPYAQGFADLLTTTICAASGKVIFTKRSVSRITVVTMKKNSNMKMMSGSEAVLMGGVDLPPLSLKRDMLVYFLTSTGSASEIR